MIVTESMLNLCKKNLKIVLKSKNIPEEMESHPLFLDETTQYRKDVNSPQVNI